MVRRATILVTALAVILFAGAMSKPASADVSFSFFYSNLAPYGTWAVSADYGQVWRPYEYGPGWNPYYDGHWVYTDYGWAWVSDYAWGSVPYHYGTWALDPALGWIWVPGYVWAPSWVVFSSGPDYIGWAPVPPRYVVGASLSFSSFAPDRCVIVPARSFLAPRVRGYAVPRAGVQVALAQTHVVNNIRVQNHVVFNQGPNPRGIERAVGRSIRTEPIARVKHVSPTGRFDAEEVRADRHLRDGEPRVTAPEPPRQSGPRLTAPQPGRPSEPARPSAPPRQGESGRHSAPARQAAPPHRPEAVRPPMSAPRAPENARQPGPARGPEATHRPAPSAPNGATPGGTRPSAHGNQQGQVQQGHGHPGHGQSGHGQPASNPSKSGKPSKPSHGKRSAS